MDWFLEEEASAARPMASGGKEFLEFLEFKKNDTTTQTHDCFDDIMMTQHPFMQTSIRTLYSNLGER